MRINHLIFLIHPLVYEALPAESIRSNNYWVFLDREREIKERWLNALRGRDKSTLFLQLYGAKYLQERAKEQLGESNVCYVQAEGPVEEELLKDREGQMRGYYKRLTDCIYGHMKKYNLDFDPATVTSELWGESFEGCAPGYGGAFAEYMGLKQPLKMRFEMTLYDSRFLYGARRWETVALPGTDIEAWVFECFDGSIAAIFQARLSAQWLDKRLIHLNLNPTRIMVSKKTGYTVWPEKVPVKGDPDETRPFVLKTSDEHWIRANKMNFDDVRDVIKSATVSNPSC